MEVENLLNGLSERIMRLPGIDNTRESFVMMELLDDEELDGEVFFKFMSDAGVTDNPNGRALQALLRANKVPFVSGDDEEEDEVRKFYMLVPDLQAFLSKMEGFNGNN